MVVCLFAPSWPDFAVSSLPADLLTIAPRIAIARDVVWADVRGLAARETAVALLQQITATVADARAGVAHTPIVAQLAAQAAQPATLVLVDGDERSFIAPLSLTLFANHESLLTLLEGVGIHTCGQLAALEREAVEVRFGCEAVQLWLWSRAQDERRLFATSIPQPLHASTDFIDYVVTDPERLIFVANALFGSICDQLRDTGRHARRILLTLSLADKTVWQRTIRPARPTASRAVWLRLVRALLERITVSDAVTGVQIAVVDTEAAGAVQGDLFDAGFATASAVENAVTRLVELQGEIVVQPEVSAHPLVEERTTWAASRRAGEQANGGNDVIAEMHLQLLREPREVLVETINRRDHIVPIRYRDGQWQQLVSTAGPDRISGGKWDQAYAREYFRAVTVEGQLVWLYRDARHDKWYLHGYWD
jgi:protein ImuB